MPSKVLAALVAVTLMLAGCSEATKKDAPEPAPSDIVNGVHTQVLQMPDGFRNVGFTCYGHNGVYVTSRGSYQSGGQNATPLASSVFVLPADEHCR